MKNSVDPDQMASSSEAIWSGSTLFAKVEGRGCREQQYKG